MTARIHDDNGGDALVMAAGFPYEEATKKKLS